MSSVVFAYDPSSDTGFAFNYDTTTTCTLTQHNGTTTTVLKTATVAAGLFANANINCIYQDDIGKITVLVNGDLVIEVFLTAIDQTLTDNFNRADSATTAGPNWTVGKLEAGAHVPVIGITNNQLYPVSGDTNYHSFAYDNRVNNRNVDMSIKVTGVGTWGNNGARGLAFRINPATGAHHFITFNTIYRYNDDGSFNLVYDFGVFYGVSFQPGDTMRVVCNGTSGQLYKNGAQVGPGFTIPNDVGKTRHGIAWWNNGVSTFDDWVISHVIVAAPMTGTWAGLATESAFTDTWDEFCWTPAAPGAPADPIRTTRILAESLHTGTGVELTSYVRTTRVLAEVLIAP